MDIFSLGCVIAELSCGSPFMSLPLLLKYIESKAPDLGHESAPAKVH